MVVTNDGEKSNLLAATFARVYIKDDECKKDYLINCIVRMEPINVRLIDFITNF